MKIQTGKGTIPLMVVLAVWSLSLDRNLPGLAITPVLAQIKEAFGNVSQLEVQMLTVMPNFIIIPFMFLAGHLAKSKHKVGIIVASLIIYASAGVLYLLAHTIIELIIIGILLGIGSGLLIPFSTGIIADIFVGKYRTKQMGIISGIGNLILIVVTVLVGILARIDWHLPFLVYLMPLISLALLPWLKQVKNYDQNASTTFTKASQQVKSPANPHTWHGVYPRRCASLFFTYFFYIFVFSTISYYVPFLMEYHHMDTTKVGIVQSMLYVGMFISGILLPHIISGLKKSTFPIATIVLIGAMLIMVLTHTTFTYALGCLLVGAGVGVAQPIIYDKAPFLADSPSMATMMLAFVLTANYGSISLNPVIIDVARSLFHTHSAAFPYWFTLIVSVAMLVLIWIIPKAFPWNMSAAEKNSDSSAS